ncbi:hypothetical protein OWV82_022987 [Melia azedarach]|uniref:Uncharacterized protein n=1 Tax=Melia azedarach TaxID=155640 RepID=A0ACC1WVT1_MELAZ|nr:hypothetical protein OWV82_022987 [Melia azedarach]
MLVFKAGKPILDQDSEDRIQEILAKSYIPRDLFSDYSLKATGLISFIPEITKKGMAPKREKKKKDGRAAMNKLAEFIAGSTPDIGFIDIPNPPELAMFNVSQSLPMEAKDREKKDLTTGFVPTDKRKRRKLGMSVEASSSSPIHVMDITVVKWDRYEHLIPVVKSMERSVNREWADLELRAEDAEILALCSEMSHKAAQKLKNAQKTSSLERECESYKKEVKRLETRVAELVNEKISVQLASEKRDLYLAEVIGEKDKLTSRVTELDLELLATIQAKGQAEGNAYVKGVYDIVGMFRKKFPLENLDFLDKALQVARDSLESGSEDEEENTDCEKENDYEGMISDGVGKEDADENDKVTGGDPENHEKDFLHGNKDR